MSSLIIERKVEGGKLFRLRVTQTEGGVSVRLTGDFFLEPEEGIEIIESTLAECLALSDRSEAERRMSDSITNGDLRITGFDSKDLIDALWEAKNWSGD
jgi:hypothetical protein